MRGTGPLEFLVGALIVLGFLAIVIRFIARHDSGGMSLPRIVDDSIGMWVLRGIARRRLSGRPWVDAPSKKHDRDPVVSEPTRARRLAATPRDDAARQRIREVIPSRTPVADLRRRMPQGFPRRRIDRGRQVSALAALAAAVIVTTVALGAMLLPPAPKAEALGSTGGQLPSTSASSPGEGMSASAPGAGPSSPAPSATRVQVPVPSHPTGPEAEIVALTRSTIPGHTLLSVSVRWSIITGGSTLDTELFQWRTDRQPWTTVRLASSATRTVRLTLPPGHTYTFRVRATDKAANVGAFASRQIRI